jgi:hypothetical protein
MIDKTQRRYYYYGLVVHTHEGFTDRCWVLSDSKFYHLVILCIPRSLPTEKVALTAFEVLNDWLIYLALQIARMIEHFFGGFVMIDAAIHLERNSCRKLLFVPVVKNIV